MSDAQETSIKYWPFGTPPESKLSDEEKLQIDFMKKAYAEGFSPHVSDRSSFQISQGDKGARIIYRGRNRWEVLLGNTKCTCVQAFVNEFKKSGEAALAWMRNDKASVVVSSLEGYFAHVPKGMKALVVYNEGEFE